MSLTIAEALRTPGIDPIDARVLLQHLLGLGHAQLIAHGERPLSPDQGERWRGLVARRMQGEPVAYLIGWREFYGRRFQVGPDVLVPRPETELLVELALARLPPAGRVLDLGTGSGNVALTLACERRDAAVVAVDRSAAALAVARANALALDVSVDLLLSDWFSSLGTGVFDLIVSNPPYVAADDPHLIQGDLPHEPRAALTPGVDGLAAIARIVRDSLAHLTAAGWLLFEHGFDQGPRARELLTAAGFQSVFSAPDLAGIERVSGGRRGD